MALLVDRHQHDQEQEVIVLQALRGAMEELVQSNRLSLEQAEKILEQGRSVTNQKIAEQAQEGQAPQLLVPASSKIRRDKEKELKSKKILVQGSLESYNIGHEEAQFRITVGGQKEASKMHVVLKLLSSNE